MTREEKELALYCLKASSDYHSEVCEECTNYPNCDHMGQDDVTETIIKILEQQPCDDAISRNAVYSILNEHHIDEDRIKSDMDERQNLTVNSIASDVSLLPSVTQKSGKWIPVSERLPEEGQEILFSTKTGRVHSGKYHDDDSANQWYSYRDKCRAWNNVVSAWMPLPKPYKSEGSETKQDLAYADQETMMPAT